MTVLTLSRQLGSEGDWIARQVARELGLCYMDHQIINRAARKARVPEVALAHIDELGFLGLKPTPQAHRAYLNAVESLLLELAERGDVIVVGCGAQVVLRNFPGAIHVQVVAPLELRIARLMSRDRIPEDAAINRLLASDKRRATYVKDHYGVNWSDPSLYDVLINTRTITPERAAAGLVAILGGERVKASRSSTDVTC